MDDLTTIKDKNAGLCESEAARDPAKTKERRQKRADIQIYRPGALRLMKESGPKTSPQKSSAQGTPESPPKIGVSEASSKSEISSVQVPKQEPPCKPKDDDDKVHYQSRSEKISVKGHNTQSQPSKGRDSGSPPNPPKQSYKHSRSSYDDQNQPRQFNNPKSKIQPDFPVRNRKVDQQNNLNPRGQKGVINEEKKKAHNLTPQKGFNRAKSFENENFQSTLVIESSKNYSKSFSQKTNKEGQSFHSPPASKKPLRKSLSENENNRSRSAPKKSDNRDRLLFSDSSNTDVGKPVLDKNKNCHPSDVKDQWKGKRAPLHEKPKGNILSGQSQGKIGPKRVPSHDKVKSPKEDKRTTLQPKKEMTPKDGNLRTRESFGRGAEPAANNARNTSKNRNDNSGILTVNENSGSKILKDRKVNLSLEDLKLDSSLEYSSDDPSENEESSDESVNPMMFVEFENSFNQNMPARKTSKALSKDTLVLSRTPEHSQSIQWADEKWSPMQKQRAVSKKNREIPHSGSPTQRGIIQFATSAPEPTQEALKSLPTNQKKLFNPNNPSKPVLVTSATRDASSSWDSATYALQESGKTPSDDHSSQTNLQSNEGNDNDSKFDLSILYNIQKGEMDINYYVSSNQLPQEFRRIMDIRLHLQGCYRQLLVSDIRLCQEKNIEGALWKSLYYVIIEKLREYINRDPSLKDRSLSTLHMIVDEGHRYLQSLLTDLQQAYSFSLDSHLENDLTTLPSTKNRVKQAIHSCQKILLSIGDLARYKEQYSLNPNFCIAKNWYQMALQVQPRNGRPFNQLAIIAVSLKRPLDVVYYYIRSLSAANPFASARDSLISMFDDIRKKYETMDKKPLEEKKAPENQKDSLTRHRRGDGSLRQEIWIRPDSGATNKRTLSQSDPDEEVKARIEELMKMQTEQLMKSFLTCYLHCHGMLFSKVGLDHFTKVLGKTLDLFQALLHQNPPRMSPIYLLQIMAINMFAIENTQLKDSRLEGGYRSAAQELALLLGQEMFARVAEVMVTHFPSSINCHPHQRQFPGGVGTSDEGLPTPVEATADLSLSFGSPDSQRLFLPPLAVFVPAAKVWCDWLLYQSFVWNPPPTSHDLPPGIDAWGAVGELATIVKGVGPPDVVLFDGEGHPPSNFHPLVLPEDKFLRGYSPIMSAHRNLAYAASNCSSERCRDWLRIKHLQVCLCRFLCGVEPPILKLQKTDKGEILVPVVTETPPVTPSVMRDSLGGSELDLENSGSDEEGGSNLEDELDDLDVPQGEDDPSPLASTVRLLAHRKKVLERKQRQQRKMQALMEGAVTLEMEVRPRYLVPDTNCFIEHFEILKALINKTPYTLMIPLVVLKELKGLSKDAAVDKYGDVSHAVTVREDASSALDYLKQQRSSSLKYVTSEGSLLPTSTFTDELNVDQDSSNDDKILSCCINFCSSTAKKKPTKEGVRHIYREVVLLTEDRNLRVKAYARDVPVRDLLDFAHWAGIK